MQLTKHLQPTGTIAPVSRAGRRLVLDAAVDNWARKAIGKEQRRSAASSMAPNSSAAPLPLSSSIPRPAADMQHLHRFDEVKMTRFSGGFKNRESNLPLHVGKRRAGLEKFVPDLQRSLDKGVCLEPVTCRRLPP